MRRAVMIMLISAINISLWQPIHAAIKLPAIISSNMVLQRNTTASLWGWADAKEEILIEASWLQESLKTTTDKNGEWRIDVKTTNSKEPQKISIVGESSSVILDNVLFGEVWLCSGQSNMQQPVKGFMGQPTFGSLSSIMKSENSKLRLFSVDKIGSKTPLKHLETFKSWQQATPKSVPNFSAVAYFFGMQLQEILDVPVGIIHTSWGASTVESWMSREALAAFQKIDLTNANARKNGNKTPTALFNAMLNPLIPYSIKGVLWYQGESNRKEPENYKNLFPAMIKDWRDRWEIGDFPIYFAQIAPFTYGKSRYIFQGTENSAFMREAQQKCVDLIPNSGIAILMDVGDSVSIHPPKKKPVADRLLFNALNQTYGIKSIDCCSPVFDSLIIKENRLLLKFKHAETGLYALGELEGFEIAGADKVFYPAKAKIVKRKDILVSSDQVPEPIAVRYAWQNWIVGKLYDINMLPASSFRTDNWEDAIRGEQ